MLKRLGYFLASLLSGAPVEEEVPCKPNASDGNVCQLKERRAGKVLACCDPTGADFYDEWKEFATHCCLCRKEILPGDSVILHPVTEEILITDVISEKRISFFGDDFAIGCTRAHCSPSFSIDCDGYWTKRGYSPKEEFVGI